MAFVISEEYFRVKKHDNLCTTASLKEKFMPSLKSRQSNTGLSVVLILLLIATGISVPFEYFGFTNLITNFGKETGTAQAGNNVTNKLIAHEN